VVTFSGEAADTSSVWLWIVGGVAAWFVLAVAAAMIVGGGIRLADRWSPAAGESPARPASALAVDAAGARGTAAPARRRSIPLPPLGLALIGIALALETAGFLSRLTGNRGSSAQLLSMDAPFSLPRMFVALLFAAGAVAAVAGAGTMPGRRTWWLAVGFVGGAIAGIKAGSTVHADALGALGTVLGTPGAVVVSATVAAVVVGTLWFLSRTERRDRRRILSVLALYATASVGLSALSSAVAGAYGGASSWAAGATFLEESGEALAAVAFVMAVLAGVAPRLVLPATWPLRRAVDAHTLEVPEQLPARMAAGDPTRG
jgi:hypothetical protein